MAAAELALVLGKVAMKRGRMLGRQARMASLASAELVASVLNTPAQDPHVSPCETHSLP